MCILCPWCDIGASLEIHPIHCRATSFVTYWPCCWGDVSWNKQLFLGLRTPTPTCIFFLPRTFLPNRLPPFSGAFRVKLHHKCKLSRRAVMVTAVATATQQYMSTIPSVLVSTSFKVLFLFRFPSVHYCLKICLGKYPWHILLVICIKIYWNGHFL